MYSVLLVIHVIITVAMIGVILIQRSASDGLSGIGGGGGSGFMTSRGQANLLTRMTAILATLFILNSLALGWLTQQNAPSRSIADQIVEQQKEEEVSVPTPDEVRIEKKETAPEKAEKPAAKKVEKTSEKKKAE
jgi:preprotein translocase subunit SecG